ncbi:MAG: hypothetical protein EON59_00735 [Alphaproteobacteria bacterium]|nr:MAG: hypothetical protein EON59_00735 [Alphaproteobacteria bacterium]
MANEAADWIEWAGGECPVAGDAPVHIKLRDGTMSDNWKDRILPVGTPMVAGALSWAHGGAYDPDTDIIAYRIAQVSK